MKEYYKILGVSQTATKAEIKKAYKTQAKKWHPDINKSPNAKIMMQDIIEAYLILSDESKRAQYDRIIKVEYQSNYEKDKKTEQQTDSKTDREFETERKKAEELAEKPIEYLLNLAKVGFSPFKIVLQVFIAYFIISLLFYLINLFS